MNPLDDLSEEIRLLKVRLAALRAPHQRAERLLIKAGGYPLPEDWSPRGELPTQKIKIGQVFVQATVIPIYGPAAGAWLS